MSPLWKSAAVMDTKKRETERLRAKLRQESSQMWNFANAKSYFFYITINRSQITAIFVKAVNCIRKNPLLSIKHVAGVPISVPLYYTGAKRTKRFEHTVLNTGNAEERYRQI